MDMPIVLNKHTDENAHILIWKDEEIIDFYLRNTKLGENDLKLLEKFTSERRKKDLLISRHLLQMIIPTAEIVYKETGKPFLKNDKAQISISHSKDIVALIVHPTQTVGIDIEYISPRVERVKERFLSKTELTQANTTETLTLYWSAKETLFKTDEKQGLDFIKDIALIPNKSNTLTGQIRNGENIVVHHLTLENVIITYTTI